VCERELFVRSLSFYVLRSTFYLLPSTFYLLPSTFYLLRAVYYFCVHIVRVSSSSAGGARVRLHQVQCDHGVYGCGSVRLRSRPGVARSKDDIGTGGRRRRRRHHRPVCVRLPRRPIWLLCRAYGCRAEG